MNGENNPKNAETNPIGNNLLFNVSIPKQIKIDLVDASALSDYEIWIFIASVMSNFLVGFSVAWSQCPDLPQIKCIYKVITVIFTVLLLFSIFMVFQKHKKLKDEKKQLNMEVKSLE